MRGRANGRGVSNEADATVQRAPGKHSLVASRYPALGKALEGRGGEPSIHDAATAAVDRR